MQPSRAHLRSVLALGGVLNWSAAHSSSVTLLMGVLRAALGGRRGYSVALAMVASKRAASSALASASASASAVLSSVPLARCSAS